jgi:hypothetical protein
MTRFRIPSVVTDLQLKRSVCAASGSECPLPGAAEYPASPGWDQNRTRPA